MTPRCTERWQRWQRTDFRRSRRTSSGCSTRSRYWLHQHHSNCFYLLLAILLAYHYNLFVILFINYFSYLLIFVFLIYNYFNLYLDYSIFLVCSYLSLLSISHTGANYNSKLISNIYSTSVSNYPSKTSPTKQQEMQEWKSEGLVVVLLGSKSDMKSGEMVREVVGRVGVECHIRVTSAHKGPDLTLKVLAEYEGGCCGMLVSWLVVWLGSWIIWIDYLLAFHFILVLFYCLVTPKKMVFSHKTHNHAYSTHKTSGGGSDSRAQQRTGAYSVRKHQQTCHQLPSHLPWLGRTRRLVLSPTALWWGFLIFYRFCLFIFCEYFLLLFFFS